MPDGDSAILAHNIDTFGHEHFSPGADGPDLIGLDRSFEYGVLSHDRLAVDEHRSFQTRRIASIASLH